MKLSVMPRARRRDLWSLPDQQLSDANVLLIGGLMPGRRCPEPGDQRQDFLEHLLRHRDLSHLKGGVAAVADDLGTDLDQLLPQAGQELATKDQERNC